MARTTLESAYLGVHDQGDSVLYLAQAASPHAIRHSAWIGQVVRLQGTAIGAALRDEVRPNGYVTTRQTVEPDTSAAAAPVVGAAGSVVAAFNIVGPMFRLDDDTLASTGVPTLSMPGSCRHNCAA